MGHRILIKKLTGQDRQGQEAYGLSDFEIVKVKVKQSRYRPGVAQSVPES